MKPSAYYEFDFNGQLVRKIDNHISNFNIAGIRVFEAAFMDRRPINTMVYVFTYIEIIEELDL